MSFSRAACWYPALVDPVQHAIVREPLVPADGWLDVPTGPGPGIDIDEAALERLLRKGYSIGNARRWLQRHPGQHAKDAPVSRSHSVGPTAQA